MSPERILSSLTIVLGLAGAPAWPAELDPIQALADRGRPEEALRRLDMHLVESPGELEARFLRGVLLAEIGRTKEAASAFRDLGRDFPDRPEPIHNLALLQALDGRPATAIVALEGLIERYPGYEAAATNLERIRRGAGSGEFDPLGGESARVPLVLTGRLGSFPPTEAPPAHRELPAPEAPADREPSPPLALPGEPEPKPPAPTAGGPAPEPAVAPAVEAAADPTAPTSAAELAPAAPVAPAAPAAPAKDLRTTLEGIVVAWARAWSEQRVRDYLGFYASDFQPGGFPSREAWEKTRRQRVAAPTSIEVEIDLESLSVRDDGAGAAAATFTQHYRSDRFSDTVRKTLGFVRRDGAWKIRSEKSQ